MLPADGPRFVTSRWYSAATTPSVRPRCVSTPGSIGNTSSGATSLSMEPKVTELRGHHVLELVYVPQSGCRRCHRRARCWCGLDARLAPCPPTPPPSPFQPGVPSGWRSSWGPKTVRELGNLARAMALCVARVLLAVGAVGPAGRPATMNGTMFERTKVQRQVELLAGVAAPMKSDGCMPPVLSMPVIAPPGSRPRFRRKRNRFMPKRFSLNSTRVPASGSPSRNRPRSGSESVWVRKSLMRYWSSVVNAQSSRCFFGV